MTLVHKPLRKHMQSENKENKRERKILEEEEERMTENDHQRADKILDNRRE